MEHGTHLDMMALRAEVVGAAEIDPHRHIQAVMEARELAVKVMLEEMEMARERFVRAGAAAREVLATMGQLVHQVPQMEMAEMALPLQFLDLQ